MTGDLRLLWDFVVADTQATSVGLERLGARIGRLEEAAMTGTHPQYSRPTGIEARLEAVEHALRRLSDHAHRMEGHIMAAIDDLKAQVAALVAEDGVILAEIDKLVAKGPAVGEADVQAAADAIKAEVQKMSAKVAQVDPPAPITPPAP